MDSAVLMLELASVGQVFSEKLPWTPGLDGGNMAGSRALPAPPWQRR